MGFRICENCAEERAVTYSDLCEFCEDAFDENAMLANMTPQQYAKEMGVTVLPR